MQLERFPGLATRDGDALTVTLFPTGTRVYRDSVESRGEKTYAVWDFLEWINAVLLFTTEGERSGFVIVQRANGRGYPLPSDPVLAPDRRRLVTADFCPTGCDNEVVVWSVAPDRIARELSWRPDAAWTDASVQWKDADTLLFEFTVAGDPAPRTLERKLGAPDWRRGERR
jgi:hypothetical protein